MSLVQHWQERQVFGLVEATLFEQDTLWEKWHAATCWVGEVEGVRLAVHNGQFDTHISVFSALLNDHVTLFWHATSILADYATAKTFLENTFKPLHTSDAANFHNIVSALPDPS